MKKKIIITGGLGYIGTELCKLYSGVSWHHKIIVIDSSNHEVLTTEGVKDMRYLKEEALDHWIQLQQKAFDELAKIQYIMKTT